jgi:hypothetical protein
MAYDILDDGKFHALLNYIEDVDKGNVGCTRTNVWVQLAKDEEGEIYVNDIVHHHNIDKHKTEYASLLKKENMQGTLHMCAYEWQHYTKYSSDVYSHIPGDEIVAGVTWYDLESTAYKISYVQIPIYLYYRRSSPYSLRKGRRYTIFFRDYDTPTEYIVEVSNESKHLLNLSKDEDETIPVQDLVTHKTLFLIANKN